MDSDRPEVKRGRLSPAEDRAIIALVERGFSTGRIAQKLNRCCATVNFAMHRLGLRAPVARQFCYRRGRSVVRSFSPDEDAFIEALRCQGFTYQRIGEIAGTRFGHQRSAATIGVRLKMLANRDEHRHG